MHFNLKKVLYKCVDIISNGLRKNTEASFFEGGGYVSPLQYRGMVNIKWLLSGVRTFDFFADVINKRHLIH